MDTDTGQVLLPALQMYVLKPAGYDEWSPDAKWRWQEAQQRQIRNRAAAAEECLRVARAEKYEPASGDLVLASPGGKRLIRGLYGPLKGLKAVTLLVCDYDERIAQARAPGVFTGPDAPEVHGIWWSGPKAKDSDQLVFQYGFDDEREAPVHYEPVAWGPKRFVFEILRQIADAGGNAVLYLIHSDLRVEMDADAFRTWAEAFRDRPETALLEARQLLGGT